MKNEIVTFAIFEIFADNEEYTRSKYITTVLDSNEIKPILNNLHPARKIFYCKLSSFIDVYPYLGAFEDCTVYVIERQTHKIPDYLKG